MSFLRIAAIIEGTSFLVLLAAMFAHRLLDGPDLAAITGPIHGIAFLGYIAAVLVERGQHAWGARETLIALIASVIPAGTFYVERKMMKPSPAH